VWDTNPTIPPPFDRPPGPFPVTAFPVGADDAAAASAGPDAQVDPGRGLLLVRLCADAWGGYALGDELFGICGKLLWFELARRERFAIAA
jgi:hypothetical protein